jgi:hypothetical protein
VFPVGRICKAGQSKQHLCWDPMDDAFEAATLRRIFSKALSQNNFGKAEAKFVEVPVNIMRSISKKFWGT